MNSIVVHWSGSKHRDWQRSGLRIAIFLSFFILAAMPGLVLCANAGEATDRSFMIQGYIEEKEIRISPQKTFLYEEWETGFDLHVSECRWLMKLGTRDPRLYDYRIVSSDGTNAFLLLNYETRARIAADRGRTTSNIGDGTVASGTMPRFLFANEAGAVWLAFASECFFSHLTEDARVEVPFTMFVRPSTIEASKPLVVQQAKIAFSDSQPRVPLSIAYYLTNLAAERYSVEPELNSKEAFTNVVYEASAFTNVQGLQFPKHVVVSIWRPDPRRLPVVVAQLCSEFRVTATNIVLVSPLESFKPPLPGRTIVTDQRFNNGTNFGVAYFRTNTWPDDEEVKHSAAFAQAKADYLANAPVKDDPNARRRRTVILVALPLLPVAFFLIARHLRRA